MKNSSISDCENQKEEKLCSVCGRKLVTDWEKEHGLCVYCNNGDTPDATTEHESEYHPTSSPWLRSISRRYDFISWLIQAVGIILAFLYAHYTNYEFTIINIIVIAALILLFMFAGLIYSAIGAHMKGMADIVDGIEFLSRKK